MGQDLEADCIGSLHDLQPPCSCALGDERQLLACASAISKDVLDERKHSSRPKEQLKGTVTVSNISGMYYDTQQEAQRMGQDVPLATFDFLARVVARRIERSPPFWAPLAVCESMTAAVGWFQVLRARAPQHKARDGSAPTCRPNSRARDNRAPYSSAAGLSAMPSTGTCRAA
jgi:hypothetical protein